MPIHTLTELQYSNERKGPFVLYIYNRDGYHSGRVYFDRVPRYPEEGELTCKEAMARTVKALADGLEVRITDGGDMLVYHARGATVLYPAPTGDFWHEVGAYDE